ncbi:hypothetical protein BGZ74_008582 [Mortierella antarctica]|nr:hypothetical protein BGZ74_008582 [Mortierella antarctica]
MPPGIEDWVSGIEHICVGDSLVACSTEFSGSVLVFSLATGSLVYEIPGLYQPSKMCMTDFFLLTGGRGAWNRGGRARAQVIAQGHGPHHGHGQDAERLGGQNNQNLEVDDGTRLEGYHEQRQESGSTIIVDKSDLRLCANGDDDGGGWDEGDDRDLELLYGSRARAREASVHHDSDRDNHDSFGEDDEDQEDESDSVDDDRFNNNMIMQQVDSTAFSALHHARITGKVWIGWKLSDRDFQILRHRFFLHAAAQLLYADPFKHATTARSQFELVSLLLASVIHTQCRHSESQSSVRGDKPFTATEFLSVFGLELSKRRTPPLLQDAILGISPITVDYAQHLKTNILGSERDNTIMSPPVVPQQLVGSAHHTTVFDIRGNPRRVDNLTGDRTPGPVIQGENIETITFDISGSKWYHPMADKLPLLRTVCVRQAISSEESDHKEAAAFFVKHRLAFPHKRPVHLDFHPEWETAHMPSPLWNLTSDANREDLRDPQQSRIELYRAVVNPVHMNASMVPDFYENIQDIGLDSLETFVDGDSFRCKYEDPFSQREFLQQCHNIATLNIATCDPDLFKWVQNPSDSAIQGQRTAYWSKLQSLGLLLFSHPAILNQALAACGKSLHTLEVCGREPQQQLPEGELSRARPIVFGDWTLPFLKTIEIDVCLTTPVHIGDLSGCPLVESLRLSLAFVGDRVRRSPVWKLPRLQRMELEGAPVLEYNYNSLDHCPDLRTVTLVTRTVDCHVVASYEGMPIMSHRKARSQVPDNNNNNNNNNNDEDEDEDDEDEDEDSDDEDDPEDLVPGRRRRMKHCNLPNLRKMTLIGHLDPVVCLSWLDGCPALEYLELKNFESGDIQPHILPSLYHPRLGSKLKTIKIKGSWVMSEDALVTLFTDYAPYLTGLYVESIDCLPPRLTRDTGHGGWILQMLLDALQSSRGLDDRWEGESTGGAEVGTTWWRLPGDTLRLFTCGYVLSRSEKKSLALHGIINKDMKKYRDAGILVISMRGQYYVRKHDRMNC